MAEANVFRLANIEAGMGWIDWAWWWMWRENVEDQDTRGWDVAEQLVKRLWSFFVVIVGSKSLSSPAATEV